MRQHLDEEDPGPVGTFFHTAVRSRIGHVRARRFARACGRPGRRQASHRHLRRESQLRQLFPGADGLANAAKTRTQVDRQGKPYATLPQPINTSLSRPAPDPRFPADLPNKPFDITRYVPIGEKTGDLVHRYWHEIEQINGGKMDKFAAWSDAAGLAMGY